MGKLKFKDLEYIKIEQYINRDKHCDIDIDRLKELNAFYKDYKNTLAPRTLNRTPICDIKRAMDLIKEWKDNDFIVENASSYPLPLQVLFNPNSINYKKFSNRILKAIPLIDKSSYSDDCMIEKEQNGTSFLDQILFNEMLYNKTTYSKYLIPYAFFEFIYEFTKYQIDKQN